MATYRKATRKTPDGDTGPDLEQQAESMARTLGESAQQVWLAGIGALSRAQSEGTRLFESLVQEGQRAEREARHSTTERASEVMQAVGSTVDEARERAGDTWDKWEKAFDERMQRTLARMGVPGRDDIAGLNRRIDELTAELRRQRAPAPRKAPAKKAATRASRTPAKAAPAAPKDPPEPLA